MLPYDYEDYKDFKSANYGVYIAGDLKKKLRKSLYISK